MQVRQVSPFLCLDTIAKEVNNLVKFLVTEVTRRTEVEGQIAELNHHSCLAGVRSCTWRTIE